MLEPEFWTGLELEFWASLLAVAVALFCVGFWVGRRGAAKQQASKSMSEIEAFWNDVPWMKRPLSSNRETSSRVGLQQISSVLNEWHRSLRTIQPIEPLLAFVAGEEPKAPAAIVQASFRAVRTRLAKTHAACDSAVRTYVRANAIDAYLAFWAELVGTDGFDGVFAQRDRLAGVDEPGLDALLGAELALTTYGGDDATMSLAVALAEAAALVRDNLFKVGIVIDWPNLLCPAALASTGFRALYEPGDSTRTVWLESAREVAGSDAFKEVVGARIVVAVAQFGFKRDGRVVRPTLLCGYNPPEWQIT